MARKDGSAWLVWLLILAVVGALAAGGVWYWKFNQDKGPEYRTGTVTRGDLTQVVTATGQLNPVVNVQVGSQVSGIISKLNVDFNSPVTSNQVVAQLDPSTYKAARDQSEGDLESAKAALELSQVEANRADELYKAQLISSSDHDKAKADLHQAQATVMIKTAALEQAQVNLDRTTIYSPINGVVISRSVDVGQTVAASFSAPVLFVIANDLAKMQIDAAVSEADVGSVAEGQNVTFMVDAFPSRTFRGQVTQIRNAAITNQNVVTYDSVVSVDNSDQKLKPGMTATVSIIIDKRTDAVKIPNAALRFRPPDADPKKPAPNGIASNAVPTLADAQPPGSGGPRPDGSGGGPGGRQNGGGGRPGGGGAFGAGGVRPRGDRPMTRTVYILAPAKNPGDKESLQPVQIKTGISDGSFTEVTDGLKEGDVVVVGLTVAAASGQQAPGGNPFGGGGGGFRRF